MKRGILARLGAARTTRSETVVDAIVEHLNVLLNSRRGESVAAPTFGIPDFTELVIAFPQSTSTLEHTIRSAIQEYEPRLEAVTVKYIASDDQLVLRFEIAGRIVRDKSTLRLKTSINPGGHARVSR